MNKNNIKFGKSIKKRRVQEKKKKGTQKNYKNNQKRINKVAICTYLSIVTVNVNGLNAPTEIHRVTD